MRAAGSGAGWWARQPIERKFPAAFVGLIALVAAFHTIALYREVERSSEEAVVQRMDQVGREISQLASQGSIQRMTRIKQIADSLGSERTVSLIARDSTPTLLLDSTFNIKSRYGAPASGAALARLQRDARAATGAEMESSAGPLFEGDSALYYWTLAVTGDSTRSVIAQLRRISQGSANTLRALQTLIGEMNVIIANAGDYEGPWMQMEGPQVPAADPPDDGEINQHTRAGVRYMTRSVAIPGSRWVVITETPRAMIQAQATAFALRIVPFTLAFIVLGGILAWLISKRITRPMRDLAGAALAIGSGDYHQRVAVREGGDLGRMASAFNQMAAEVERSNNELDERVKSRTAELENVNNELQSFSYSVSHDLRSPLRSIDGFSQALLEDYGPQLDSTAQDYLARLRGGAQRMGHLIDDLLMLSRVARQPLERTSVDVSAMCAEIVEDLQATEPGRAVSVDIEPGLMAHADHGLLHVVLQNLVGNAWKFTSQTGNARIQVGSVPCDGGHAFFVKDNGAGFDMAYAEQLFAPFQRLHSGRDFSGTGIGLATVQRVVSRHGGRIWADAEPHAGATFYFMISEGSNAE